MSALSTASQSAARDDNGLVDAVRRGDDAAFGELYARYGRRITAYVLGMVGDHGRAEDIMQEVFISALRRMRQTERPIAFKPWVYEIARNACIDEFRRSKRNREVLLAADEDPDGAPARVGPLAQPPDATLERRQQLDDLRGAFRGLSDSHHKVIVLRELEGLSYTEIGKRLGMTRPVVESTLFRARRRLNEEYEEIASGRRCEQVCALVSGGEASVRALGVRERRRVARHVSHCQPCHRHARAMGIDDAMLRAPSLIEKVAALLPIPAFLGWRRAESDGSFQGATGGCALPGLRSAQSVAQLAGPASPTVGLGRVAAAIAAVAIAGGGVAGGLSQVGGGVSHARRPLISPASSALGAERLEPPTGVVATTPTKAKPAVRAAGGNSASSSFADATSSPSSVPSQPETAAGSSSSVGGTARSTGGRSGGGGTASSSGSGGASTSKPSLPKLPVPLLPQQLNLPGLPPINLPPLPSTQTITNSVGKVLGSVRGTVVGGVTGGSLLE